MLVSTMATIEQQNKRLCLLLEALGAMYFGTSIMAIYYEAHGLSHLQVYMLQSTLYVALVAADMPSGYWADRIGVRRIILIGMVLRIVESAYFVCCSTFWQFEIALVLTGISTAVLSNASSTMMTLSVAYIADSNSRKQAYDSYEAHANQAQSIGLAIGIGGGWWMIAQYSIGTPYLLQLLPYSAAIAVALRLANPPIVTPVQRHRLLIALRKAANTMLVTRRDIRCIIALSTSIGAVGFMTAWLLQARMELAGITPKWFALIYGGRALAVAFCSRYMGQVRRCGDMPIWTGLVVGIPAGTIIAGATTGYVGLAALLLAQIANTVFVGLLLSSYLQRTLPQDYSTRNAELAVRSTIIWLAYAAIGPICGLMADAYSLRMAFILPTIVCFGFSCIALFAFRKNSV